MRRRLWIAMLLGVGTLALAKREKPVPEPPEVITVTEVLIRDGHWDRAAAVLATATLEPDDPYLLRLRLLQGLVDLHEGRASDAVAAFREVLAGPSPPPETAIHLARALLETGEPKQALTALDAGAEALAGFASTWQVRGAAHDALGDAEAAYTAWTQGQTRFPGDIGLRQARVQALLKAGLGEAAHTEALPLLGDVAGGADLYRALGQSLRTSGSRRAAIVVLEEGHLMFPADTRIVRQLALLHLEAGHPHAAGHLLADAAFDDPTLYVHAAEAYRQARSWILAESMNAEIPDPVEKTRQRLGLLLEEEAWARAVSLEDRVRRHGLDREDPVRYGLAYAHAQLDRPRDAERWLKGIGDPEVFESATRLREQLSNQGTPP